MTGNRQSKIIILDEGTTSTRAMLFDAGGTLLGSAQRDLTQYYPAPGMVEHDAAEIWDKTLTCLLEMIAQAGGAGEIAAIGITNQRETVVFWDRESGQPLTRAIVWQDRRTAERCASLKAQGAEATVQAKTGLLLDPYFSGSKLGWALENWPEVKRAGSRLMVGTIDSWLVYKLTGGAQHLTDASNASRTALMDIEKGIWDDELCALFGVPVEILPTIADSIGSFGASDARLTGAAIPITGIAGDQQAATIGQACLSVGETKATYGTGAFVLTNTGTQKPVSTNRLLGTILYQQGGERHYALEGSVFVAGSLIQWLRDGLKLIASSAETEGLARSVADNGGVTLIPALSGLGAPWWRSDIGAAMTGMSFATGKAHIVRAALEAMAHQTHDLQRAFAADGADWAGLKIDGGMSANDWIAQDLADILQVTVERPLFVETTALGAAMLAAVGAEIYPDLKAATVMRGETQNFAPQMSEQVRSARVVQWRGAMERLLG